MRWTARDLRSLAVGLAYLAPALFIFVVFVFIALSRTFYLSCYNTRSTGLVTTFNGIDHYIDLVTSQTFRSGLVATGLFALYTVPLGIALGLILAVLLNQRLRGISVFRTMMASTIAISAAVGSLIWLLLFNAGRCLLVADTSEWLQAFTQIHLLTRGGPVDATRTLVYSIYLDAFQNFQFGFASAESVVLFVLVLILTLIQFRFVERLVHYQ